MKGAGYLSRYMTGYWLGGRGPIPSRVKRLFHSACYTMDIGDSIPEGKAAEA
jgi:hypothetical protein